MVIYLIALPRRLSMLDCHIYTARQQRASCSVLILLKLSFGARTAGMGEATTKEMVVVAGTRTGQMSCTKCWRRVRELNGQALAYTVFQSRTEVAAGALLHSYQHQNHFMNLGLHGLMRSHVPTAQLQ